MISTLCIVLAIAASLALVACVVVMDRAKNDRESATDVRQQLFDSRTRGADLLAARDHAIDGWTRAEADLRRLRAKLEARDTCVVCRRRLAPTMKPHCDDCIVDVEPNDDRRTA